MPRYRFETQRCSGNLREHATRVAAERFPELAFEPTQAPAGTGNDRETWICRAPSEAHLRRWAAVVRLRLIDFTRAQ